MDRKNAHSTLLGLLTVVVVILAATWGVSAWRERDHFTLSKTREVPSSLDGQKYRVHLAHDAPAEAADRLAAVNRRTIELIRHLRDRYVRAPPGAAVSEARRTVALRLLGRYNPDNLAENSPRDPDGDTSYTINKGVVLALCLREGAAGGDGVYDLHDVETLTFVTFHELAHIGIKDIDHPDRFWRAFKFLLEEADEAGLIRNTDYARRSINYCGLPVDYNPFFDRGLPSLR